MDLEKDERVAFKGLLEAPTPAVPFVDALDELYLRQENCPRGLSPTFWRLVNLLNVYGTACG
jgi:hypothetical protein